MKYRNVVYVSLRKLTYETVGLSMTQLIPDTVYPIATGTYGRLTGRVGTIPISISLTSPVDRIEYRVRSADELGTPVVQDWTVAATNLSANAPTVYCERVPKGTKRYLIDLRANSDDNQIVLGTSPITVGYSVVESPPDEYLLLGFL